jgi:hypothetical protein
MHRGTATFPDGADGEVDSPCFVEILILGSIAVSSEKVARSELLMVTAMDCGHFIWDLSPDSIGPTPK